MRTKEEIMEDVHKWSEDPDYQSEIMLDIRDQLADLTGAVTQLVAQGNREENSK